MISSKSPVFLGNRIPHFENVPHQWPEHVLIEKNRQSQTDHTAQYTNAHFFDERIQRRHDHKDTDRYVRPPEPLPDWIKLHGGRAFYGEDNYVGQASTQCSTFCSKGGYQQQVTKQVEQCCHTIAHDEPVGFFAKSMPRATTMAIITTTGCASKNGAMYADDL